MTSRTFANILLALSLPLLPLAPIACSSASDDAAPASGDPDADTNDGGAGGDGSDPGRDGSRPSGPDGGGPEVIDGACPVLTMPTTPATLYVDGTAAGAEDGTMGAPYRTVAKALQNAGPKAVIWIAAGTYGENLTVPNKDVVLVGGFAKGFGSRTDACATILEAANAQKPVLDAGGEVKSFGLDGLWVRKGSRGLAVDGDESVQATYTITSSVFSGNGKPNAVGGAAYLDHVSAKVSRSIFRDNIAAKGGAIACAGTNVSVDLDTNLFEKNIGYEDHGGALYLSPKTGRVTRSTFRGNEIGKGAGYGYGWGGAVIVFKAGAAAVKTDFSYNVFTDNLASIGGAVFVDDGANITMSHDLVYKNRAFLENGIARGAIYVDGDGLGLGSTLVADHLTVVGNSNDAAGKPAASIRGGGVYVERNSTVTFKDTIFWNAGNAALWADSASKIIVSYSVAPNTCAGGGTCQIGAGVVQPSEIAFADETGNDYHEKSAAGRYKAGTWVTDPVTSAAIDKADPAEDIGGEPSPNGGRQNLGVYGGTAEASKSP